MPLPRMVSIATQIASAMAYMHSIFLMHRDLKSPNILLDSDWHVYITDFGTARVFGKQDRRELEPLIGTTGMLRNHDTTRFDQQTSSVLVARSLVRC
jgi:serine/threonine protein kinase